MKVDVDDCDVSAISCGSLLYEDDDWLSGRSAGGDLEAEGERDIDIDTVSLVLSLLIDVEMSVLFPIGMDCNLWPCSDSRGCL